MHRALLVNDEGPSVGFGHRTRMAALGVALTRRGVEVHHQTTLPSSGRFDGLVVVDSYRVDVDASWVEARVLSAVDDLDRDLDVDVLIDPSPGYPSVERHRCGRVLLGHRYALIRASRTQPNPIAEDVRAVTVTPGGSESASRICLIVADLIAASAPVEVTAVVGPVVTAQRLGSCVRVLSGLPDLDEVLAASDVVVTAGGVTMLEALRLGRPTIAVAIADNQCRAVAGVAALGAIERCLLPDLPTAFTSLVSDPARRRQLSSAARCIIDGEGAGRVADELLDAAQ